MTKNLVNGSNIVVEEIGDEINLNLSSTYENSLQQTINNSFKTNNIYSRTETIIGQWIDGRPIYRRCYDLGFPLSSGTNNYNHGISNLDLVLRCDFFTKPATNSTTKYTGSAFESSTNFLSLKSISSSTINITVGSGWSSSFTKGYIIVIEYVKTAS